MTLTEYIAKSKISRSEFARRINVSPSYVTMLCDGAFWPSRRLALEILEQTGGKVTPNDLLGIDVKSFKQRRA